MLTLYIYLGAFVFWLGSFILAALLAYFVLMFVLYSFRMWRIFNHPDVGGRAVGAKMSLWVFVKATWFTLGDAGNTSYGGVYFPLLGPTHTRYGDED
jgi:hypothetical protein